MITVQVYLMCGIVHEYQVASPASAREHADAIIQRGYRSVPEGSEVMTYWPPHQILKVKVDGGALATEYRDKVRAT